MDIIRLYFIVILLFPAVAASKTIMPRVAVTANFKNTFIKLNQLFKQQTGISLTFSSSASGVLYTQILHGAPYDLFLSADQQKPQQLFEQNKTKKMPMTYAQGQLALISCDRNKMNKINHHQDLVALLKNAPHVVIANPQHAPYGIAAETVLQKFSINSKIVVAQNVNDAYRYIRSCIVDLGFVALSSIKQDKYPVNYQLVPIEWYSPIIQDMVLLTDNPYALQFWHFMQSDSARKIILESGYLL